MTTGVSAQPNDSRGLPVYRAARQPNPEVTYCENVTFAIVCTGLALLGGIFAYLSWTQKPSWMRWAYLSMSGLGLVGTTYKTYQLCHPPAPPPAVPSVQRTQLPQQVDLNMGVERMARADIRQLPKPTELLPFNENPPQKAQGLIAESEYVLAWNRYRTHVTTYKTLVARHNEELLSGRAVLPTDPLDLQHLAQQQPKTVIEGGENQASLQALLAEVDAIPNPHHQTVIAVIQADCVDVAGCVAAVLPPHSKAGMLNMAHACSALGGYWRGMDAQEEELSRRGALSYHIDPVLNLAFAAKLRAFDASPAAVFDAENTHYGLEVQKERRNGYRVPFYGALYSEEVEFFRDSRYQLLPADRRYKMAILTSAALDLRSVQARDGFDSLDVICLKGDRKEAMRDKIRAHLATAIKHGIDVAVLGAFGCGAFRNKPNEIAGLDCEVLQEPRFKGRFQAVVLPIIDPYGGTANFALWSAALKAGFPNGQCVCWTAQDKWANLLPQYLRGG